MRGGFSLKQIYIQMFVRTIFQMSTHTWSDGMIEMAVQWSDGRIVIGEQEGEECVRDWWQEGEGREIGEQENFG